MEIVIKISEERFRDIQRIAEVQLESNHFVARAFSTCTYGR